MALQKFDDLWFRTALSEQAESREIQYLKKNPSEYLGDANTGGKSG